MWRVPHRAKDGVFGKDALMKPLRFNLTAVAVIVLCGTRLVAQNPIAIPTPNTDPPAASPPVAVPPQPGTAGSLGALQEMTGCPCPVPDGPPAPPPYGGPLLNRQNLFGDWGGARGVLREHGFTFNIYSTNFYSGVASGGLQDNSEYRGRMDYLLHVDGEKAGLWKGSFVDLHAESDYGNSINKSVGSLLPVSLAQSLPNGPNSVTALTGVKFTQALSENFIVFGGKINALDSFNQPFTGGARGVDGFQNTALLFNPVFARTVPYSAFGAGAAYLKNMEPVLSLTVFDTNNTPTTSGFNTFFDNGVTLVPAINIPTQFFGLPGHQGIMGTYSSGRYTIIDKSSFINQILGVGTPQSKSGSWSMAYSFDQALYVASDDPKQSWGTFGNLGLADKNPSPFRWFGSIGLGGSSPLPCRKLDSFGIGYFYLGVNDSLKNLAPRLLPIRDEHGVEMFYNVGVTP
jgi:porin